MRSGREREERADKCAGEIMNMKMFCDPRAELFSPTLMPNATLVSAPEAVWAPISVPWPRIKQETPEEESVPVGWRVAGWREDAGGWENTPLWKHVICQQGFYSQVISQKA